MYTYHMSLFLDVQESMESVAMAGAANLLYVVARQQPLDVVGVESETPTSSQGGKSTPLTIGGEGKYQKIQTLQYL